MVGVDGVRLEQLHPGLAAFFGVLGHNKIIGIRPLILSAVKGSQLLQLNQLAR